MATVVFIVANHVGHLHSTIKLAHDLQSCGERVVYWSDDHGAARAQRWGFEAQAVPFLQLLDGAAARWSWRGSWRGQFRLAREHGRRVMRAVDAVPAAAASLLQHWRPDLLVFDPFLLCYWPAFHRDEVAAVALSTKPLLDSDPLVPPYTSSVVPTASLSGRTRVGLAAALCRLRHARDVGLSAVRGLVLGYSARLVLRRLSHLTGFALEERWLRRPVAFDFCLRGVPELVLNAREFDFPRAKPLRPSVHYVGPCVALGRPEAAWSWSSLPWRRHLVLCSIGTVAAGRSRSSMHFLRRVIDAFADDPDFSLVVAAGDTASVAMLRSTAPNVHVFESVPQLELLSRAQVMITHGGSSSIKECIYKGVPLLVYPIRADQPGNAARVVYHGLGLRGSRRRDRPAQIRRKVMRLVSEPSYRENLARMRRHFERYPPLDYARLRAYCEG